MANTFRPTYPLMRTREPPKLCGVLTNYDPGDPEWFKYLPAHLQLSTDSNVISTETGYFGGIGLGYTEVPELEIPEDPTDERAGRIVRKMYVQEYNYKEMPEFRKILRDTGNQALKYIRYFVYKGIHISVEDISDEEFKVSIKSHDKKKFLAANHEWKRIDEEIRVNNPSEIRSIQPFHFRKRITIGNHDPRSDPPFEERFIFS